MAWVNCEIEGLTTGEISANSSKFTTYFSYLNRQGIMPSDLTWAVTYTKTQWNALPQGQHYIAGNATDGGIYVYKTSSNGDIYCRYKNQITQQFEVAICGNVESYDYSCIYCGINDETQKGTIFGIARWHDDVQSVTAGNGFNNSDLYILLKSLSPIPPIVYNWQSVPSISGKNGILQFMSTIVDMNDGDPITTLDTTKFTLVEESNVGVITEDIDDSIKPGADAGGISGSGDNSAEQLYGYAFGQGETASGVSGGGGGLYGGFAGNLAE